MCICAYTCTARGERPAGWHTWGLHSDATRLIAPLSQRPLPAGVTFQRLFQQCRERFLVSNEMLLKTFLTEFKDHELLQTK